MTALHASYSVRDVASIADDAIGRLPDHVFGSDDWAATAARNCADNVLAALELKSKFHVASAIKAMSHRPTAEQLNSIFNSVCDAVVANAYQQKTNVRATIDWIEEARGVALDTIVAERLDDRAAGTRSSIDGMDAIADGLVSMMKFHDRATAEHLEAVATLAVRIAHALGLDEETAASVRIAARLHDIGKVSVDRSILTKREQLTLSEWETLRQQPRAGEALLNDIPELRRFAAAVRSHQERFDGAGTPDGLSGSAIPLESRIIAVADAFHSMVSGQPYRQAIAPHDAIDIIIANSGTQFDPVVVEATTSILNVRHRRFPRSA